MGIINVVQYNYNLVSMEKLYRGTLMNDTLISARSERRREDYPLITGSAHYVDDLRVEPERPATLHMVVVRSPYAHAEIQDMYLEAAQALPGVVVALPARDLVEAMPA